MKLHRSLGAAAATALVAVLVACGTASESDGVATLDDLAEATTATDDSKSATNDSPAIDDTTTADGTAATGDVEESDVSDSGDDDDPVAALLAFAACMRDHGVDMPDPEVDADGGVSINIGAGGLGGDNRDTVDAAMDECSDLMPPPGSIEGRGGFDPIEMQDQMLEFAQCMRDEGIDIDDPDFSDEGPSGPDTERSSDGPVIAGPMGRLDIDDPEIAAALEQCDDLFGGPDGQAGQVRTDAGSTAGGGG